MFIPRCTKHTQTYYKERLKYLSGMANSYVNPFTCHVFFIWVSLNRIFGALLRKQDSSAPGRNCFNFW